MEPRPDRWQQADRWVQGLVTRWSCAPADTLSRVMVGADAPLELCPAGHTPGFNVCQAELPGVWGSTPSALPLVCMAQLSSLLQGHMPGSWTASKSASANGSLLQSAVCLSGHATPLLQGKRASVWWALLVLWQ